MTLPVYIRTNNAEKFPFVHLLSSNYCWYIIWWWPFWMVCLILISSSFVILKYCINSRLKLPKFQSIEHGIKVRNNSFLEESFLIIKVNMVTKS